MKSKIQSSEDLKKIKQEFINGECKYKYTALICSGAGCVSSGCAEIKDLFIKELKEYNIADSVKIKLTGCIGSCDVGPTLLIYPEGVFYCNLKPKDVPVIVKRHLVKGIVVEDLCYFDKIKNMHIKKFDEIDFFSSQQKNVLKNCGKIDFDSLDEYIANDGYMALVAALGNFTPEGVVAEIKKSGLRGRGGGGFPTGIKWEAARTAPGEEKFVICNADEGDPGAFMDRSLLEGDPHLVIEGMAIAGYAVGAEKGVVYVRAEYPLAVERLQKAIEEARNAGLLGKKIIGFNFNFDLEIRIGAGAFVCGEETALIASVEGKRGEPKQKPPFPAQKGLHNQPTVLNNVETFGNVPIIFLKGAEWYSSIGTKKSTGTKVFALAGDINNTGLIEVPMGVRLGDIIFKIGGGIPKGKQFKVAQTGGPSGGCLTKEHLNTVIDYDSLIELGAIMGSGGLISMDEDTCMVDMARFFMDFVQDESCGKCVPCRIGTKRMLEILERITQGKGKEGDVELLIELGNTIKETALCGLGQTAPNPVLSTIKYFRNEYDEHIRKKYCRAGVCGDLFISPCQNACPAGINVPGYISLIAAGRVKDAYNLIRKDNPFPAVCGRVCTHPCELKCRRGQVDDPIAIMDLKRFAADFVLKADDPYTDLVFPKNKKSVGIIGAGPSGLTCGYYLSRLGYDVTVYEAQSVAGGVLAFGIPEYRLPEEILQKEIETITRVGMTVLLNTKVDSSNMFEDLRKKHDAIYIATGTQLSRKVGIPGENLKGIYHGIDFLRDVNLDKLDFKVKGIVAVIGGGNTAIDAARTAVRLGASEVHIIYRRTIDEMPADRREIDEAIEEGVIIQELVAPVQFIGTSSVTQIECVRMKVSGFDSAGRKKTDKVENSEFKFNADIVIPAVSQYSDFPFIKKEEVEITQWGTFVVNENSMMTSISGVFAGGDVVRGSDTAITAIADGKKAAKTIDIFLGGKGELNTGEHIEIPSISPDMEVIEHERFAMKFAAADDRKNNFDEVAQGFHKLNAIAEAMRCLRCDIR